MADIDDLFLDPNGPAYISEERRVGPPLSYVSGKLRDAVWWAHRTHRMIASTVPADALPRPQYAPATYSPKDDGLLSPAQGAFHYALNAFLALENMLGLMKPETTERLLAMTEEEFEDWLDRVQREGTVSEP